MIQSISVVSNSSFSYRDTIWLNGHFGFPVRNEIKCFPINQWWIIAELFLIPLNNDSHELKSSPAQARWYSFVFSAIAK